jgi:15-cis-phytoene synthase
MDNARLTQGFQDAEALTRQHAKTFYFASRFLPLEQRRAAYAVYAICRISDDSVDEQEGFQSRDSLDEARRGIEAAYGGGALPSDVWYAFRATVERYAIPKHYFDELLDGMEMDLAKNRYADFDELYRYCYRVAGVVGLIMLKLFGQRDPSAPEHAVQLGVAMQLTNILRDIKEDLSKGRVYLPQEEMARFGVSEGDLALGQVTDRLRDLLAFQVARARDYYSRAAQGIQMIAESRSRFVALAMKEIYAGILHEIERSSYDIFAQRARVSDSKKLRIALWLFLSGAYR